MTTVMSKPKATVMGSDSSGFFIESVSSPNAPRRCGQDTRLMLPTQRGRAIPAPGGGRIGAYLSAGTGGTQNKAPPGPGGAEVDARFEWSGDLTLRP